VTPSVQPAVPSAIRAGDTVRFTRGFADFPAADSWTARFSVAGASKAGVDGSASGNDFLFELTPAITAGLLPGTYAYQITATKAGARYTAEVGTLTIEPDIQASTAGALQHQDERELAMLNQELLARAQSDHTEYTIGDRSLKRETLESLRQWRNELRARIAQRRRGKLGMAAVHFTKAGA
jgi:hypothetical protein